MLHPNSAFHLFKGQIARLETIEKEKLLRDFLLESGSGLQICYAPHNEYINERAKILIVGITPGWSQTERAYMTARSAIAEGLSDEEICLRCKMSARFAGTMRTNLIAMLDGLELHERLGLSSSAELFQAAGGGDELLHTTSLIRYPCFYRGKNYSGHTPSIASSEILRRHIGEFTAELDCLHDLRVIIPLGTAVEAILRNEAALPEKCAILWGFPHPSGLNARRKDQFEAVRERLTDVLRQKQI